MSDLNSVASRAQENGVVAGEYLTFLLGQEEYGVDILKVQEIRGYESVTHIANTPEFIKGVIDLRGSIVPIIDLRILFKLSRADYNDFTVVIILNVAQRVIGVVVDGVNEVIALLPEQINTVPELVSTIDTKYLTGLGTLEERMLILVDIEKLLTGQNMSLIAAAAA